jgi:hypothetical protein
MRTASLISRRRNVSNGAARHHDRRGISVRRLHIGVIAVLVAGGDHQHARADDLVQAMQDAAGRTRVADAGRQPVRDAQPLLYLAQDQQAAVRRHAGTVETGVDRLAADG